LVGEDDGAVISAIAMGVLEQADPRARRFAGRRILRIIQHLSHIGAAVFVKRDFDWVGDVRLGREQFDVKIFTQTEAGEGLVGCERPGASTTGAAARKRYQQHKGD
jgi:hypothetical protein